MNEHVTGHRIVTLTMNPALDITTSTEVVHSTDKLRCTAARYDSGGGGINVAHVADVLGAWASAIYPAGGSAGDMITRLLIAEGVSVHPIHIGGSTRESITVNERSTDRQFRFVLPGPELEKIGYKIREYTLQKVPYLLVVGDKEKAEGRVALRSRAGEDFGSLPLAEVIARLRQEQETPPIRKELRPAMRSLLLRRV